MLIVLALWLVDVRSCGLSALTPAQHETGNTIFYPYHRALLYISAPLLEGPPVNFI